MLGFGEIFARVVVAPALGITGVGWAGDTARAVVNWGTGRKTSDVGLGREKHYGGGFAQQRQPGDFDDWSLRLTQHRAPVRMSSSERNHNLTSKHHFQQMYFSSPIELTALSNTDFTDLCSASLGLTNRVLQVYE